MWTNWNKAPMRLWQTQLNFAVFCASSACGVSSEHLNYMKHPMVMHQSILSANIPLGKPPGKFFEVVESPAPGQNFPAKAQPPGQGNTYPRGVF